MKEQPIKYPPCPKWKSSFILNNENTPHTCGTCKDANGCPLPTFKARVQDALPEEIAEVQ